jgi:hypothetical protein
MWLAAESLLYNPMPSGGKGNFANPSAMEGPVSAPDIVWKDGKFGQTSRRDAWWLSPAAIFLGFGAFLVYANWAAFQNSHYTYGPYISPFYSPELFGSSPHALFGPKPGWYPHFLPFSPALLVLWIPGLFRLTCYYYRGAYYKSFWADPPACAVSEPRKSYLGERTFPLIMQNFHRYFLRFSYIVWGFLVYDAIRSFFFPEGFGIGIGSLVLVVNVVLLGGYVFGCHAFRHMIGGTFDQISHHPVRHKIYNFVSRLNAGHKKWAWASLLWVGFSDIYVRLCSMGIWHDWRIL